MKCLEIAFLLSSLTSCSLYADTCPWITTITDKYCSQKTNDACKEPRLQNGDERVIALKRRVLTAERETILRPPHNIEAEGNDDELTVPFFAASMTKTLEHDPQTGLLTEKGVENYKRLLIALKTGKQVDFNAVERVPGATLKLVNPQGAFTFSLQGSDSSLFRIKPFPRLSTPEAAAQMIENYLLAIARDVYFTDYGTGKRTDSDGQGGSITNTAAAILQDLGSAYTGPRTKNGNVDASVLFRGTAHGDLIGPYVSQFLLVPLKMIMPVPAALGGDNIKQRLLLQPQLLPIAQKREFGVSFADYVSLQNGTVPRGYESFDFIGKRHIITGRDIATYVHFDGPYQPCYNTLISLLSFGFPFSPVLPYNNGDIKNEGGFVSMGAPDIYKLIAGVSLEALKASWAQKWRALRTLRPEAFAGLIQYVKVTGHNIFNLHSSLFTPHAGVDLLELVLKRNQEQASAAIDPTRSLTLKEASTYLLGQVYPESSPVHPSCPSGHATLAGAGITVMKALFDDTTLLITKFKPVKPDPQNPVRLVELQGEGEEQMTLASELNKLASNISMGRNFAGIHYRADIEGIRLGEEVAIRYLQDHGCLYTEQGFKGFELTKLDGTRIRITPEAVTVISTPAHVSGANDTTAAVIG